MAFRKLFQRFTETDEERLAAEVREWSQSVAGTTRIAECLSREPVRIAGTGVASHDEALRNLQASHPRRPAIVPPLHGRGPASGEAASRCFG